MSRPLFAAVICRSRGGLSANEKKEKFASNDNNDYVVYWFFVYYSQSNRHWKTEVPGEKPLRARERTNKKLTQPREQI